MDWSNPDSIFNSYDTLNKEKPTNYNTLIRFWIDPSSTVKQFIEIKDTTNGYTAKKVVFGWLYGKRNISKKIFIITKIVPHSSWNYVFNTIDSLELMTFKPRYHSWQTDGGPMHRSMIWYRVEYYKGTQNNDFVFWNFMGEEMGDDMKNFEKIVQLFENEFYYKSK